MKDGEQQKAQERKEVKYEEAMNKAFSEIFQNLKVIEEGTKKQRERIDLQRRGSAPATTLRETTATFKQPKNERERTLSTPIPASKLSTMSWVLKCCEEDENTVEGPLSGHPREAEKVSATGAGGLRECVNTEFV